jgi:hypothetical protein
LKRSEDHVLPASFSSADNLPAMPPRKNIKSPASEEPPEEPPKGPLECINHIREEAGKRFVAPGNVENVNYDIEQNFREIRALLKINAEIFSRCYPSMSLWRICGQCRGGESVTFRFDYDAVKVCQATPTLTYVVTRQRRSQRTFDMTSLSTLPADLSGIFAVKYQSSPFESFIDHDAFFDTAIMLHDDVLEPFLVKLKHHLESIHVCLGGIETWLVESTANIHFLEETFGKKLEISPRCIRGVEKPKYQLLKAYRETGKFEKTFKVANASDQQKLKKFLEFID